MNCPNCNSLTYQTTLACPTCHFEGAPDLLEELWHVHWLLTQIQQWPTWGLSLSFARQLEHLYLNRLAEVKQTLGLLPPRMDMNAALQTWPELIQHEHLLAQIGAWRTTHEIESHSLEPIIAQIEQHTADLRRRIGDHPRPDYPQTIADQLDILTLYREFIEEFTSEETQAKLLPTLQQEAMRLEALIRAEVEPTVQPTPIAIDPLPVPSQPSMEAVAIPPAPPPVSPPPAPRPPAIPLRDRLWQTLLSERTLHAMLVLGIFLIVSGALSFVIWGWDSFSPPVRVAIPAIFTLFFFSMGWYIRTQTALYRSGIALSALAALFIPIDFYTIYINFHISPLYRAPFWLLTSIICFFIYLGITMLIRSRLFGYLVAAALGSTALAMLEVGHEQLGLSLDWRPAVLTLLAGTLIIASTRLILRYPHGQWRFFADPFRYISLLTVAVLMPFVFGWRFIFRSDYDTLHHALTITWVCGGFIFGWGAIFYRSRGLGIITAITLPVATYLGQAALFNAFNINQAWHGVGFAMLVLLYFTVGLTLSRQPDDPLIAGHGRTALRWGSFLMVIAVFLPLGDATAATFSHLILSGTVIVMAVFARRPLYLYGASLLAVSTFSFLLSDLNCTLPQLSVGWLFIATLHLIIALNLAPRYPLPLLDFATPLVRAGYLIAGLALFLPLFPYQANLMLYTLGHWIALAAWGAYLAHRQQFGFVGFPLNKTRAIFHWLMAVPLPLWLWILFTNQRPPDFTLPLAFVMLAWGMVSFAYWLGRLNVAYQRPWYLVGLVISVGAPFLAFALLSDGYTLGLTLLWVGLLFFADALTGRHSSELFVAQFVTASGYLMLWYQWGLLLDEMTLLLAMLIAVTMLLPMWAEARRRLSHAFLQPLYHANHILTALVLLLVYLHPLDALVGNAAWTNEMRWWGVGVQYLLGATYLLYAWHIYAEYWAHFAMWLIAAGGAFLGLIFSTGRGSSAAKAALGAITFIMLERGLRWLWHTPRLTHHRRAWVRYSWRLFTRPMIVAGFTISVITIGLALFRNVMMGGTWSHKFWAMVALWLITGLYIASAYLFQRVRFVWLAGLLAFLPWTIMTHLLFDPTPSHYALSWLGLTWLGYLLALGLERRVPTRYSYPLHGLVHGFIILSLLWGLPSIATSRLSLPIAIALYGVIAWLNHRHLRTLTAPLSTLGHFIPNPTLYPAMGLWPLAAIYWLAWLSPAAQMEHYGLLLLAFAPLGLLSGQLLERVAPPFLRRHPMWYALPAYLTGYFGLAIGTILVIQQPTTLALALLFDALLCVISAWLFRKPLWVYPAVVFVPTSLLIALNEAHIPFNRQGWWLIALGGIYFLLSWALRRLSLRAYSLPPLTVGFVLVALGLPPSTQEQTGALWGFGAATLIYTLTAFWLRQPLLLTLAALLITVPYFAALDLSGLPESFYGFAFLPGILLSLSFARLLDFFFLERRDFPWYQPSTWFSATQERLLNWWGVSPWLVGLSWTVMLPFLTAGVAAYSAINALLAMMIFIGATFTFRLRGWLFAAAVYGHLAIYQGMVWLDWFDYPVEWASIRLVILLTTTITLLLALYLEQHYEEGSPLAPNRFWWGWSRPLYIMVMVDMAFNQLISLLASTLTTITVSLSHAILLGFLVTLWTAPRLAYLSLTLIALSLSQLLFYFDISPTRLPTAMAQLAFLYGLLGFGTVIMRPYLTSMADEFNPPPWLMIWQHPLQRFSLLFSNVILILTTFVTPTMLNWGVELLGESRATPDFPLIWMTIGVTFWAGGLYLLAAAGRRSFNFAYSGSALILLSWLTWALYIQQWLDLEHIHWYVIPLALYGMGISTSEYQREHKNLARWLDYLSMTMLLSLLFWQTLRFGWWSALLLGGMGILMLWWGSARRLRRYLYAGMVGVILATLGQLINALGSVNQWMVFGIIGLTLIIIVMVVERKMEQVKALRQIFDAWE